MKILVADDQPTVRKAMLRILRELGFSDMAEAEDGYAALSHLKKTRFDLIISDVHMPAPLPGIPAKSGIDLLEAVRLDPELRKIPFLIISNDSDMKTVVRAMQSGVSGYLIKPFTESAVREKLEMLGFATRETRLSPSEAGPETEQEPESTFPAPSDQEFLRTTF